MRKLLVAAAVLSLAACSGSSDSSDAGGTIDAGPPGGTFTMNFAVSDEVRTNAATTQPLKGPVHGAIFHTEDVSVTSGPVAGAQQVASVEVASVDLTNPDAGASAESWSSPVLPPGSYTFLGFFDANNDAGADENPTYGDPVTLPTTNQITVTDGGAAHLRALFNLVCQPGGC